MNIDSKNVIEIPTTSTRVRRIENDEPGRLESRLFATRNPLSIELCTSFNVYLLCFKDTRAFLPFLCSSTHNPRTQFAKTSLTLQRYKHAWIPEFFDRNAPIIARLPLVTRINRLPRYRYIPMIVESIDKRFSFVCGGGGTERLSVSDRTIIETLQILHFHRSLNPEGYSSARFNVPVPRVSRFRRESLPRVIEMGR